jgi:ABC-type polysaccharide/polyol phosphate export permease
MALFLAPAYVPLSLLTGWIAFVATYNPLTFLIESGRGFIDGKPTQVEAAFTIAGLTLAVFAVWARTGLRSAERAG